jgi:RNA recognition motif-containing protein
MSCSFIEKNILTKISFAVGNIPYDVTEEKLKDIFNEVGPVVSFKYNPLSFCQFDTCILCHSLLSESYTIEKQGNLKVMDSVNIEIKKQPLVP